MPEPNQTGLSDNAAGALAYFTFIPAIIFLVVAPYNTNPYVRFHSWQSLLLNICAFCINVVLGIVLSIGMFFLPFFVHRMIWGLIELGWLLVWGVCVYNAFNGNRFKRDGIFSGKMPLGIDLSVKSRIETAVAEVEFQLVRR
jgi:uncharacterized membrane protein